MRGILLLLALAVTLRVHGRVCLPDAIPESERTHVVVDGTSMPLGIWTGSWASARIVSSIYEIIVQEKIGHNTSLGIGTTSFIQIYKLAGCEHIPENNTIIEGSCAAERHQPRQHHVSLEYWYAAEELTETALKKLGEYAPENLGSIGYSGKEGMYIMGSSMNAALQDSGLALEFYRSWNRSWHNPVQYTATVPQVDLAKLRTCADSVEIGFEGIGGQYLAATGDHDGVEEINNKTVLKCWQQRWWLAPACRHNASECATVVTANVGWGLPYMIQQAFWHNMPIAFATAQKTPVDWYIPLNTELESLLYWWVPDTNFALYNPAQVLFPPNSRSQYKRQIYKTMKENTLLTNWAAKGFADIAYKAADVAKNMNIADEDIQALLVKYTKGSQDPWEAACEWLKNNDLWLEWLPNNTACIKGKGLVDSDGKFVQQRGLAVDCAMCPVGTQSVEQDDTRVCVDCEPGQYQDLPGESTCSPCQPGTRAEEPGARECKPCGLGLYANESGMTSCFQCGLEDQRELWTTSQLVNNETYIQIQGAFSETSCSCVPGTYLWNGRCEECIDGSYCPGSNNLLLEMGYFSTPEAPGEVFRCFEQAGRCPGGRPGTCAPGRDNQSIACAACLPGLHTTGDTCEVCSEGNYAMLALVGILCGSGISVLYVVLVYEGQKSRQPGSLLIAALSMGQMVTVVQQLTVIQQFKIEWGSPFSDILAAMELLAFDLDMVSISCVAPMSPVAKFTTRTLLVLLFFAMAGLVHVGYLAYKRAKTLQLGLLGRTVGTLFMVFFISLCSSLLAPFRCNMHPNGRWTVQTYHQVFCNGQDEHLAMVLVGTAACLLPICFVVICIWIILFELPKRLERADVHFIRACSFLFIRFRPGAEVFSVIFLVRNALVVLCPLLPSAAAKVVCMNILLYGSVVVTAFSKPWRVMACNFLDLLLVTGMLVILDMGSLFVQQENTVVTTVICMAFFSIMLVAIFGAILYGIAKHFLLKYRKQFRFFLCHQKVAAGSLARLLKMELQKRGSRFTTFVDCDDLNDLTRLFSYVGQDTETLVVLASPDILTRKWCVGEICTARIQRVETVVVAFPEYANPDKTFIESYSSIVPDITELANYNLGLVEVEETLRWISTLQTIALPALLTADAVDSLVTDLSGTFKAKSTTASSCPDCIILADLDNLEAAATAYIMLGLLLPKLVGGSRNSMPTVLKKDQKMPKSATSALMICSEGCFRSADVASNLLAVKDLKTCCILPIIAEDGFRFPSQAFYEDLVTNRQLSSLDLQSYVQIIKAIFQEIAVVFSPQNYSSTQEDLELRSKQVVWRLQSGDLKPLSSKLATEVSEPSPEPSVEQPLKPLGQAEQVPKVDERSDLVETANAPPMPDKIEPWESEENFSCATIISQEL